MIFLVRPLFFNLSPLGSLTYSEGEFYIRDENNTSYKFGHLEHLSEEELFQESTLYDAYLALEVQEEIMKHIRKEHVNNLTTCTSHAI